MPNTMCLVASWTYDRMIVCLIPGRRTIKWLYLDGWLSTDR